MRKSPALAAVFASCLFLSVLQGCALFAGGSQSQTPSTPRASACDSAPGNEPLVLLPNGRYNGTYARGTAHIELKDDGKFRLSYVDRYTKAETQWSGRFAWKKERIGEAIHFCDVRSARNARIDPLTRDITSAVVGVDPQESKFRVSIGEIGEVCFAAAR